jgi:minor extracellular serine protease Vpr
MVGLLAACGQPGAFVLPDQEGALQTAGTVEQVFPLVPVVVDAPDGMVNETPAAWFIQFATAPRVKGGAANAQANERALFRSTALAERIAFQERYDFRTLFNGISVNAGPAEIAKLARMPGVTAVFPVETIAIPEPVQGPAPELYTALAMTGADQVQDDLGMTGVGIKVAVMDTGIDYHHADLGGTFGPGSRVAYGWDFVGDAFNADPTSAGYNPIPMPDPDPDDCNGHGTHVAGIVGANGTVIGVAPDVTFGAYRVFGCAGSTTADIMIAAMEMAHADGMDVLNMSIGSAFQWPQYPTAVAASNLVHSGMVVVASIGNSGANGLYAAGAPGLGEDVIGVASFDNSDVFLSFFEVNGVDIGYIPLTFSPDAPTSGSADVVYVGEACGVVAENLTGKIALAARGTCAFSAKAINAVNAGAVAVVIHNNAPGVFSGTLGAPIPDMVPVVGISQADGLYIAAQAAPVLTWTDESGSFPSPTGGLISSFSSYGLSPDLALKPDIGAPGGNIFSTYPLELGGYATLSGTSMAAPHVAGAAALLLQAEPRIRASEVRGVLQNAAEPKAWSLNAGLGFLDHVHRQGAGMLDIYGAITSPTRVSPAKIAMGEGEAGAKTHTLWIENNGDTTLTYDLSFVNALSTGGVITPSFFGSDAFVRFDVASVTVRAGGKARVRATISPATGPVNGQYGGYIVATPRGDGLEPWTARVPFAGFVGDYQGIQVLSSGGSGFPLFGWSPNGVNFGVAAEGDVFTLEGWDIPFVLAHFDHHARTVEMNIINRATGRPVHPVFHSAYVIDYFPRNSTPGGFFALDWDGSYFHSAAANGRGKQEPLIRHVPNGDYILELRVLKALGDVRNPNHWETWRSPWFTIARP